MCKFEKAITRTPCATFANGLTPGLLGKPDVNLAKEQHKGYISALQQCGLKVEVLPADDQYPDSCFVEDPAIVTDKVAIMTSPCDPSRKGEELRIRAAIDAVYGSHVETLTAPATLEGGDICQVGNHFFIGLSRRTNDEGGRQLAAVLKKYGFTSSFINIRDFKTILHLKTGISYLGNNTFICMPEIASHPELAKFKKIITSDAEGYSANCIRVNDTVIMPQGFDGAIHDVEAAGFTVMAIPVTEFRKQDGGLSCLSLRIPKLND